MKFAERFMPEKLSTCIRANQTENSTSNHTSTATLV